MPLIALTKTFEKFVFWGNSCFFGRAYLLQNDVFPLDDTLVFGFLTALEMDSTKKKLNHQIFQNSERQ